MTPLLLPYPLTVNHMYDSRGWGGAKCLKPAARIYRTVAAMRCNDARNRGELGRTPMLGRLAVTVQVRAPDRRSRDLDNLGKCLLDALTKAGVWQDDAQIDRLTFVRAEPIKGGAVLVSIEPIQPAETAKE